FLNPSATAALKALARRHQVTLSTIVQAAWALVLGRYSGEQEVTFGVTASGRPADLPGVETMVGLFVNSLPLRVRISSDRPLHEWLKELQARQAERRPFEHAPLTQVRKWSSVPPGRALFESLLAFENYPVEASRETGRALAVRDVRFLERT